MCDQPAPFVFPELDDEAAAALDQFLEDLYNRSSNSVTASSCIAITAPSMNAPPAIVRCPPSSYRWIHRSENRREMTRGVGAAVTIVDGPSPIVKISPSN